MASGGQQEENLIINIRIDGAKKSVRDIKETRKSFTSLSQKLEGIVAGFQVFRGVLSGLRGVYDSVIGQNERFTLTLIRSQTFLAANARLIDTFGEEIEGVGDKIDATQERLTDALNKLRIDTRELVGVTSQQVEEAFGLVTRNIGDIVGQTKVVGDDAIDSARRLTKSFVAGLATLQLPREQFSQEIRSILSGDFNTPDSILGRALNLDRAEFDRARASGELVDFLIGKLETFEEANKRAAKTLSNAWSNIIDSIQIAAKEFGEPISVELSSIIVELDNFLKNLLGKNSDVFKIFGQNIANSLARFNDFLKNVDPKKLEDSLSTLVNFGSFLSTSLIDSITTVGIGLTELVGIIDQLGVNVGATQKELKELTNIKLPDKQGKIKIAIEAGDGINIGQAFNSLGQDIASFLDNITDPNFYRLGNDNPFEKVLEDITRFTVNAKSKIVELNGLEKELQKLNLAPGEKATEDQKKQLKAIVRQFDDLNKDLEAREKQANEVLGGSRLGAVARDRLRLTKAELEAVRDRLKETFPNLKQFLESQVDIQEVFAKSQGISIGTELLRTYNAALEKLNEGLGTTPQFAQRFETVLKNTSKLVDTGVISVDEATRTLARLGANDKATTNQRIQAQQELTKVLEKESKKRLEIIEIESDRIAAQVASGNITSAEAAVQNLDVQSRAAQERIRSSQVVLKTQEAQLEQVRINVAKESEKLQNRRKELERILDNGTNTKNQKQQLNELNSIREKEVELQGEITKQERAKNKAISSQLRIIDKNNAIIQKNNAARVDAEIRAELDKFNVIATRQKDFVDIQDKNERIRLAQRVRLATVTSEEEVGIALKNEKLKQERLLRLNANRILQVQELSKKALSEDQQRSLEQQETSLIKERSDLIVGTLQTSQQILQNNRQQIIAKSELKGLEEVRIPILQQVVELTNAELVNNIRSEEATKRRLKQAIEQAKEQERQAKVTLQNVPKGIRFAKERGELEARLLRNTETRLNAEKQFNNFSNITLPLKEAELKRAEAELNISKKQLQLIKEIGDGTKTNFETSFDQSSLELETLKTQLKQLDTQIKINKENESKGIDAEIKLTNLQKKRVNLFGEIEVKNRLKSLDTTRLQLFELQKQLEAEQRISALLQARARTKALEQQLITTNLQNESRLTQALFSLESAKSRAKINSLKREEQLLTDTFSIRKRLEEAGKEESKEIKRVLALRGEGRKTTESELRERERLQKEIADEQLKQTQREISLKLRQTQLEVQLSEFAAQRALSEAQIAESAAKQNKLKLQQSLKQVDIDLTQGNINEEQASNIRQSLLSQIAESDKQINLSSSITSQAEESVNRAKEIGDVITKQSRIEAKDSLTQASFNRLNARNQASLTRARGVDELRGEKRSNQQVNRRTEVNKTTTINNAFYVPTLGGRSTFRILGG